MMNLYGSFRWSYTELSVNTALRSCFEQLFAQLMFTWGIPAINIKMRGCLDKSPISFTKLAKR